MRTFTNKKAVPVKQTAKQKLQYVRKNWQLYLFFLMPALLLTIIFKYIPMSGVLIAFEDYNVIDGVFGSEWVGLEYFQRFLSSPDFMNYLMNTLKLSAYGLLWGFPVPITDLCTEFYFRNRSLWYDPYVSFSGRTNQSGVGD